MSEEARPGSRTAAGIAVLLGAILCAAVLLGGGGGYEVRLRLESASQLVKGNLVQVSGEPVGTVEAIRLTEDGQAELTVGIEDAYAPLREGTRAVVRQSSLSGVANRYVDLQQGSMTAPEIDDGALLPAESTESAVDLDQLFDVFDERTRRATRTVIEGFADLTEGRNREANEALRYLNPALSASQRLFEELARNDDLLERFVVETSRLVTDVADKRESLAGIVDHFGTVSTALASRDEQLGEAVRRLPGFLRKANTTFVNLRATLDDLDPLVAASKPVVRDLRPLLADLRPFARDAGPTFSALGRTIRRSGSDNDLVELLQAQTPLARAALDSSVVGGRRRRGAFPELTQGFRDSTPPLAFLRPYSPELTGWFDDFSTTGGYDALGNYSRAGLALTSFSFTPALTIVPVDPTLRDEVLAANAKVGRNNRCPGALERDTGDRSTPFRPTPDFNCDPTMVPPGP